MSRRVHALARLDEPIHPHGGPPAGGRARLVTPGAAALCRVGGKLADRRRAMTAPAEPLVFIVDDDPSVRRSLARLVKATGYDVEVFASAREFLAHAPHDRPTCLVLDERMPGLTGLELQETLATAGQRFPIVFITGYRDVRASVKAMKNGAIDFLTKPVDGKDLLGAIERAVTKARQTREELARVTEVQNRIKTLSPREAEVFALVVTGMLNKQIAGDLGVTEKTVKVHRGRLMEKMQAGSLAELVRLAYEGGLISPHPSPHRDSWSSMSMMNGHEHRLQTTSS